MEGARDPLESGSTFKDKIAREVVTAENVATVLGVASTVTDTDGTAVVK